jgi:hypothetical protein
MERAILKPPSPKRPTEDDNVNLDRKAFDNGLGASGGPSVVLPTGVGQGTQLRVPEPPLAQPPITYSRRRANRENRSFNFNCKMRPSIKAALDAICDREDRSQADILERLILEEAKRVGADTLE